jgi:hypothetical protein
MFVVAFQYETYCEIYAILLHIWLQASRIKKRPIGEDRSLLLAGHRVGFPNFRHPHQHHLGLKLCRSVIARCQL